MGHVMHVSNSSTHLTKVSLAMVHVRVAEIGVQAEENVTKVLQGSVRVCPRSSVMQLVPGATKMEVRSPCFL